MVNLTENDLWSYFLKSWEDVTKLEPIDYAYAPIVIQDLKKQGHEIEILTTAGKEIVSEWLLYWGYPYLKTNYVTPGTGNPKDIGQFDMIVDDKPEHCQTFYYAGKRAVIFYRPWNKYHATFPRIKNFIELKEWV